MKHVLNRNYSLTHVCEKLISFILLSSTQGTLYKVPVAITIINILNLLLVPPLNTIPPPQPPVFLKKRPGIIQLPPLLRFQTLVPLQRRLPFFLKPLIPFPAPKPILGFINAPG